MNLHHRSAVFVRISRPAPQKDALGSTCEGFAAPHQAIWASLLPQSGSMPLHASGLIKKEGHTLLLPSCVQIAPGDGVGLDNDAAPVYRCVRVQRYPMHVEALIERRCP